MIFAGNKNKKESKTNHMKRVKTREEIWHQTTCTVIEAKKVIRERPVVAKNYSLWWNLDFFGKNYSWFLGISNKGEGEAFNFIHTHVDIHIQWRTYHISICMSIVSRKKFLSIILRRVRKTAVALNCRPRNVTCICAMRHD